jgi:hypothetical protein
LAMRTGGRASRAGLLRRGYVGDRTPACLRARPGNRILAVDCDLAERERSWLRSISSDHPVRLRDAIAPQTSKWPFSYLQTALTNVRSQEV